MKFDLTEIRQTLVLAIPLAAAATAQVGMEVVDTIMMGRLGPQALAAGSMGSAIFIIFLVVAVGVISGAGVLVARAYGSKNTSMATQITRQGFWLTLVLTIPGMILIWLSPWFLIAIGEARDIVAETQLFLYALVWALPATVGFLALREFVAGISRPRIIMFIAIADIPLNALGNYLLMYGKWGLPALGIAGIGYATVIVSWLSLFALMIYIVYHPNFKSYGIFQRLDPPHRKIMKEIIQIGWPVGMLYGLETGLFSVATLMMGYFDTYALAAHQIALQMLTLAFMPPLGISQASAVRVSQEMGGKNFPQAKRAAYTGLLLGIISACIAASFFWFLPKPIISLFINIDAVKNADLVSLAIIFLSICAIFEIFDALQVILVGILRGFKDTVTPMWLGLVSYWFVGIGAAYLFGFKLGFNGTGIWIGLALGIAASAFLLFLRMQQTLKRECNLER